MYYIFYLWAIIVTRLKNGLFPYKLTYSGIKIGGHNCYIDRKIRKLAAVKDSHTLLERYLGKKKIELLKEEVKLLIWIKLKTLPQSFISKN